MREESMKTESEREIKQSVGRLGSDVRAKL